MSGTRVDPQFDLSQLPTSADGARSVLWWSNLGFMLIEGTAFALAAGAYLYLQSQSRHWPPRDDAPPDLFWGVIFTIGLVMSAIPNAWVSSAAKKNRTRAVRIGVLAMTLVAALLAIARAREFAHLNVHWTSDAYGSVVWLLMVLHTSHLLTDLGESFVIALWLHTHEVGPDQFADVEDNANYWYFVILAWLPLYALVYWVPRW